MEKKNQTDQTAVQWLTVGDDLAGQRLDNFLLRELKGVPKSWVYRVIRKGEVRVNKKRCKPESRLEPGDLIRVPPVRQSDSREPVVPDGLRKVLEAAVVFEDESLLVVNKPHGLAVHGGSGLNYGLIEGLRALNSGSQRWELVHRLDRETSGLIMVAKQRKTLLTLQKLLQTGRVEKVYQAWVDGRWPPSVSEITAPLAKNVLKSGERIVVVHQDGKQSLTRFSVLSREGDATLVEARPVTGRTHQIRVHAQFAGYPIIGDPKYLADERLQFWRARGIHRMCLHAARLEVNWPGRARQVFEADWAFAGGLESAKGG